MVLEFLKKLIWDEAAFERYARAALLFGSMYLSQTADIPPYLTAAGVALAGLISAGDRNPPRPA